MNINDIEEVETFPENIWEEIFKKQWDLATKYKDIEGMGDLLITLSDNVNTSKGQKWIKDFAWRVTEELTEADEAHNLYFKCVDPEESTNLHKHYIEELIDALHFLTELTLIAGYDHNFILGMDALKEEQKTLYNSYDVIYALGLMCNCLKNKPWKQTQMLTDIPKFETYLKEAWSCMILLFYKAGLDGNDIYSYYFKKNSVNKFRIRSKRI